MYRGGSFKAEKKSPEYKQGFLPKPFDVYLYSVQYTNDRPVAENKISVRSYSFNEYNRQYLLVVIRAVGGSNGLTATRSIIILIPFNKAYDLVPY